MKSQQKAAWPINEFTVVDRTPEHAPSAHRVRKGHIRAYSLRSIQQRLRKLKVGQILVLPGLNSPEASNRARNAVFWANQRTGVLGFFTRPMDDPSGNSRLTVWRMPAWTTPPQTPRKGW